MIKEENNNCMKYGKIKDLGRIIYLTKNKLSTMDFYILSGMST